MWRCSVCGYIHDGDDAPEHCPKCGAAGEKFTKLAAEAAELIERSRYTNSLHMTLSGLLTDMIDIAEEGIEDNLDPNCVKIFAQSRDFASMMIAMINAELTGHMNKGKWG